MAAPNMAVNRTLRDKARSAGYLYVRHHAAKSPYHLLCNTRAQGSPLTGVRSRAICGDRALATTRHNCGGRRNERLSVGRRTIKRWDSSDEANWFVELTAPFCKAAGIKVGDQLTVSLVIAAASTPRELEVLLQQDPQCRVAWGKLSEAARRTIMEHIRAGKSETIRVRRAESAVQDLGQLTYVRRPAKK